MRENNFDVADAEETPDKVKGNDITSRGNTGLWGQIFRNLENENGEYRGKSVAVTPK